MSLTFDHVGLTVADLPAMTRWYGAAFGMLRGSGYRVELLTRPGNQAGLQAANPVEAALTRGFGHIAFDVPDVDVAYAALLGQGATDRMSPRPSPEPDVRMAFVADPEGNLVELLDRGAVRAAQATKEGSS